MTTPPTHHEDGTQRAKGFAHQLEPPRELQEGLSPSLELAEANQQQAELASSKGEEDDREEERAREGEVEAPTAQPDNIQPPATPSRPPHSPTARPMDSNACNQYQAASTRIGRKEKHPVATVLALRRITGVELQRWTSRRGLREGPKGGEDGTTRVAP